MDFEYYAMFWFRAELTCKSIMWGLSAMIVASLVGAVIFYELLLLSAAVNLSLMLVAVFAWQFSRDTRLRIDELVAEQEEKKQLAAKSV